MAATQISRSGIGTNDDGSGTTGTVINVAYIGLIYDNVDALFSATTGITLNQAGGDGAIFTLESSDVAHGVTTVAGTQAYATFAKQSATAGGLVIHALSELTEAFALNSVHTTEDGAKSNAATASQMFSGFLKSGTGTTVMAANTNIVAFRNGTTTRFILDGDGDSHQDVGTAWTNFDAHDDVALLTALSGAVSRADDPLKSGFNGWLAKHRDVLERERIVTINDGPFEDGSVFINWSRANMLVIGAVRQLAARQDALEARLLEA